MATIQKRKRSDGSTGYRVLVRIKRDGKTVHQESRTFDRLNNAKLWARRREEELDAPGAIEAAQTAKNDDTIANLIDRYIQDVEPIKPLGKTKRATLIMLSRYDLATIPATRLTAADVISHCKTRAKEGAGPATISQDISYLRVVLGMCKAAWSIEASAQPVMDAQPILRKLGLIGSSKKRDRRPEEKEIDRILAHFEDVKSGKNSIPIDEIIRFALASGMRQGEICRIRWEDLNEQDKTIVIRDRKDPQKKHGNDQLVPLLGESFDIVKRQPKIDPRIFPYSERSVGAAWRRYRDAAGVKDLMFHDLRHEAATRLFEMGYSIQEVALVTGHKDWNMLRRYTHLRAKDLHAKYKS